MKSILTILAIAISFPFIVQGQGHVRISFKGLHCLQETADDIFQLDGKGDEVYMKFNIWLADAQGNIKLRNMVTGDVYGDNTGAYPNRINAGSALDLFGGNRGGIKGGDRVTADVLVNEFDMSATDVLCLLPVLWEWDPGVETITTAVNNVNLADRYFTNGGQPFTGIAQGHTVSGAPITEFNRQLMPSDSDLSTGIEVLVWSGATGPRMVGLKEGLFFTPGFVVLDPAKIQRVASTDFGYGLGIIPVKYDEVALNAPEQHGQYVLLLKVDYTSATSAAPAIVSSKKKSITAMSSQLSIATMGSPSVAKPMTPASTSTTSKLNSKLPPSPIAGKWTGDMGMGKAEKGNTIYLELQTDYVMSLVDGLGTVTAQGEYALSGNVFSASFTAISGEQFKLKGTLSGNMIKGTWTSANVGKKSGNWSVSKK